ncbi:hypothetical protein AB0E62_23315 [Streptomyces sp. NPDC038707]|uniref:hypothetical protein n=1 Tax=unclassified Streptomyces TaxID=2593676 RepID=UPI0033FEE849
MKRCKSVLIGIVALAGLGLAVAPARAADLSPRGGDAASVSEAHPAVGPASVPADDAHCC